MGTRCLRKPPRSPGGVGHHGDTQCWAPTPWTPQLGDMGYPRDVRAGDTGCSYDMGPPPWGHPRDTEHPKDPHFGDTLGTPTSHGCGTQLRNTPSSQPPRPTVGQDPGYVCIWGGGSPGFGEGSHLGVEADLADAAGDDRTPGFGQRRSQHRFGHRLHLQHGGSVCVWGGGSHPAPQNRSQESLTPPRPLLQPLQSIQPLLWVLWEELGALWVQPKLWVRPSYGSTPCCGSAQAMGQPTLWVSPPHQPPPPHSVAPQESLPTQTPGMGPRLLFSHSPGFCVAALGPSPKKSRLRSSQKPSLPPSHSQGPQRGSWPGLSPGPRLPWE